MDDLITRLRAAIDEQQERGEMWANTGDTAGEGAAGDELLRMVAAHRKILDLHKPDPSGPRLTCITEPDGPPIEFCEGCSRGNGFRVLTTLVESPCETVKALAEGYGIVPA